jgi:hypothetical protein
VSAFVKNSYRSTEKGKNLNDASSSSLKKKRANAQLKVFLGNEAMQLDERNSCGMDDNIMNTTTTAERKED